MRPRATVEVRNDSGQSLLSIAAQNDDLELAQVDMMMDCECLFIHYRYNTSLASSYSRIGRLCWMTTSPTAATS